MIGDYQGTYHAWPRSVWIGYDPREVDAFVVARQSILKHEPAWLDVHGIILADLEKDGTYTRKTLRSGTGFLKDQISDAPMSTEFAISRFLTPHLAGWKGWALYMDCDMLIRSPLHDLFALADPAKAVMCVKHHHEPKESVKMDGQAQVQYARKNWSSVMLFNCEHPANREMMPLINRVPGRDLHRFCWLSDDLIGELPPEWNFLVGYNRLSDLEVEPKIVHFTLGVPSMVGNGMPYADEWTAELHRWVRG